MLLGELFTVLFSAETQMHLDEGKSSNHSVNPRQIELAIFSPGTDGVETVHAIPMSRLRDGAVFGFGDFRLRVLRFFRNSEILDVVAADSSYDSLRADKGMGTDLAVKSIPRATAMDMRDLSSAFVEIETPDGKNLVAGAGR